MDTNNLPSLEDIEDYDPIDNKALAEEMTENLGWTVTEEDVIRWRKAIQGRWDDIKRGKS